ncbi:uncharacterized protein I303_104360 [Kwoniella dejecticola CBS 10117]|uniref:F-box domain-containing protein n=1 Tax=Kwoniella dejecticola CBS 10117 TaxID=1296121 RepID=A0A1A6A5J6_9TREE|nr:uncharacterized protein I303_04664 [Kwoniella dejecticola CBS 10117]OBR85329.1 hypothetical protein I303_04664 [Kwoniella dejecticola CBS 10117]
MTLLRLLLLPLRWFDPHESLLFPLTGSGYSLIQINPKPRTLRLPTVVLSNISSFCDVPTLFNLIQVSCSCYDAAAPSLYRDLSITTRNSASIFRGLAQRYDGTPRSKMSLPVELKDPEALLDQPYRLFWPETPPWVMPLAPIGLSRGQHEQSDSAYPTRRSHYPKLKLLSYVRELRLVSLPPCELCRDLQGITKLLKERPADGDRPFSRVRYLHVGPQACTKRLPSQTAHGN